MYVVFCADHGGQVRRRKQRVAPGKTHLVGMEIAPGKMGSADFVVIRFDGRVFVRLKHRDHFLLCSELKHVVVVPCVAPKRLAVALEQLHLAVDGEHLLDERPPEVEQPHRKRSFVFCAQGQACLLQKLTQVGAQIDNGGRFATACRAGFNQHAVRDFAGAAEALRIEEAVISAESADRLTLVGNIR